MPLSDAQITTIIDQIEEGKTLSDLLKLYEDRQEVVEIYETVVFLQAQRIDKKPDPSGLKSALEQAVFWDDEPAGSTWHQWFARWRWFMGGSLSFALLFLMFSPWENQTETLMFSSESEPVVAQFASQKIAAEEGLEMEVMPRMDMAMMAMDAPEALSANSEMDDLITQLQSDFESEFAEYRNLKESVMPLVAEEMFSAQVPVNIDAL